MPRAELSASTSLAGLPSPVPSVPRGEGDKGAGGFVPDISVSKSMESGMGFMVGRGAGVGDDGLVILDGEACDSEPSSSSVSSSSSPSSPSS